MRVLNATAELRHQVRAWRTQGKRCALVPTMGFLHEGHLSLVDHARRHADIAIMSIFVNPLQFGPREDLATYPRDLERDLELARGRGVDAVFAPASAELLPRERPAVTLIAPDLTDRLCGRFRPGHFEGVLTIVAKLFNATQPDVSVFGQKDFQQSVLIRRMVADLDFPIHIVIAPIVRESDGLALSSRNIYLTPEQRAAAATLFRALTAGQATFARGQDSAAQICAAAQETLLAEPLVQTQYLELVGPERLEPVERARAGDVLAGAAFLGTTRLIDNIILK
ncbi:MAG: pantoate--beta-alanine ligase [Longimicrobiales bacterium]